MPGYAGEARVLKVFLASPSDVVEERGALSRLVRDINDVLTFLAPERRLSLELVRYETHSYPDIGRPQDVINRQIPIDYDIFIGVMWRRCGTPTATSPSGTIEEFRRAVEKRSHGHLPRIMFYFCEQLIPIPDAEELEQLREVVQFRDELAKTGLTWTYPSHAEFAEHARGGLLRAIRDILQEEASAPRAAAAVTGRAVMADQSTRTEMLRLAADYDEIRRTEPSGGMRTRHMTAVFSKMKAKAAGVQAALDEFEKSDGAGTRLAAIAILQMFPDARHLQWLAGRLDNPVVEAPFIGFQAAVALLEAVRALPPGDCAELGLALEKAKPLAEKLPSDSDRLQVLSVAAEEYGRKCGR